MKTSKHLTKSRMAAGLAVWLSLSLSACGGSAKDSAMVERSAESYATADYDMAIAPMENGSVMVGGAAVEETAGEGSVNEKTEISDTSRKLIKTVNMSLETKEFDTLMEALEDRVEELGGYIESMDIYNGSSYSGGRSRRNATLSIRIPQDRLPSFLDTVSDIGNVVRSSEYVEDVTLTYVDLESRRKALETERDRLMELMERAENIEDIITIEGRLSEVRYQIESMESQLRTYDNQVDYSTVDLSVEEVQELTPVEERTAGQRMGEGFADSVENIVDGAGEFGIWFVIHLPYLVVILLATAAFTGVVWLIVRHIYVRQEKKRTARSLPVLKDSTAQGENDRKDEKKS